MAMERLLGTKPACAMGSITDDETFPDAGVALDQYLPIIRPLSRRIGEIGLLQKRIGRRPTGDQMVITLRSAPPSVNRPFWQLDFFHPFTRSYSTRRRVVR